MEGFTDSDNITDAFSNHYNELYNSVDYDQGDMNVLYNNNHLYSLRKKTYKTQCKNINVYIQYIN